MSILAHPPWCSPEHCTADERALTAAGYQAGHGGEHRSIPVALDGTASVRIPARGPIQSATVAFTRSVAPWRCSTYVTVALDGVTVAVVPLETGRDLVAQLGQILLATPDAS